MIPTLHSVPIESIKVLPQARKAFSAEAIDALAKSISQVGLLQPLLCSLEGNEFCLIDGGRRLRACLQAGLKDVPVLVAHDRPSAIDALTQQLTCNLQREDLSVLEQAGAIRQLMDQGGMTAEQVAKRLGRSPATISRTLSVLKLPEQLRAQVASGHIPADTAYALARVEDPARQAALAAEVTGGKLTRDALNRKLKRVSRAAARQATGPSRVTALLGGGRSLSLSGAGLSIDSLIETLEQLLTRAKKSKSQGLSLSTFVRTLRDQAAC